MTVVLEATGLGKRYRRTWALRDCSVAVPEGRVVALVGPNGAGKSTLLHLAVGLLGPSAGDVRVFGVPAASGPETLGRVGFLAQDKPLYHGFTVAEMLRFGARLNPRWDQAEADRWLERFDLPPGRRVGQLSGGQRTQLALALALAKRPRLLLLDEPMADLDPLVRHDLTRLLMETVAAEGLTVVFSSHVLAELATVCDYLVLLATGRVQLAGDTDELLAGHRLLVGPLRNPPRVGPHQVVEASHTDRQTTLLVRTAGPVHDPSWAVHDVGLEQLVLVASGWQVTAFARDSGLAGCVAAGGDCQVLTEEFTSRYRPTLEPVSLLGALLPVAIGLLFGGPLLARELEHGTHRLAWTQSVTRSRWLAARLAVAGAVLALVSALAAGLLTWWWGRFDELGISSRAALERGSLVPVATAVLAFAIATTAGALTRRVVPALATGLVAVLVVAIPLNLAAQAWLPHDHSPSPTRPASQAPVPAWTTRCSQAATATEPAVTCPPRRWTGSAPAPPDRRSTGAWPPTASSGSTATNQPAAPGNAP